MKRKAGRGRRPRPGPTHGLAPRARAPARPARTSGHWKSSTEQPNSSNAISAHSDIAGSLESFKYCSTSCATNPQQIKVMELEPGASKVVSAALRGLWTCSNECCLDQTKLCLCSIDVIQSTLVRPSRFSSDPQRSEYSKLAFTRCHSIMHYCKKT